MPAKLILDVRSATIRTLEIERSFGGASFRNPGEFANSAEGLASVRERYPQHEICLLAPPGNTFVRELTLPFSDRRKVREILPFELEAALPFSLDEIVFDSYIFSDPAQNSSLCICFGLVTAGIEPFLRELQEQGFRLGALILPQDAVYQISRYDQTGENGLHLHIGEETSVLLVLQNNRPVAIRTIGSGTLSLLKKLSGKLKKKNDDIAGLFRVIPPTEEQPDKGFLKKHLGLTQRQLNDYLEIGKDFGRFWYRQLNRNDTAEIVVTSELLPAALVVSMLSGQAPSPLRVFPADKSPLIHIPQDHYLAAGAALAVTSGGLNLLRDSLRGYRSHSGKLRWIPLAFLVAGILAFILSFTSVYFQRRQMVRELQRRENQIFERFFNRPPTEGRSALGEAREITEKLRRDTEVYAAAGKTRPFSELLVEVHRGLSGIPGIFVSKLDYSNGKFEISAEVPSFTELGQVREAFRNSGLFQGAEIKNERALPGPGGRSIVRFNLILRSGGSK